MAANLPLPRQVLTHAHWTLGRSKMSKSKGNVVNPFFALDRFGMDTMRYYLAFDGGLKDDANYENSHIIERYLKGLQNGLGNFLSRTTRGKGWSVPRAVKYGKIDEGSARAQVRRTRLTGLAEEVSKRMEELNPGAALNYIMNTVFKVILSLSVPACLFQRLQYY